ncbi:MAG TPA: glycerol kinase GlpK [Spirochaetia bacterium]|nr:glycerol kinase GlpK [Spirochaetia bacterium]
MGDSYIIAVDQSTSATKAILFDGGALPVHRVTLEHKQYFPKPGWVEHDPSEILENTKSAVRSLVHDSGVAPAKLTALAITNQRETIVAWDSESGKPLYRAIVWQDERGLPYCGTVVERMSAEAITAKTGLIVDSYFSASKLQWLVENVESVRAAAANGRLMCGTIDSWLIWNLTGGKVFATDYSNASRTLLFDITKLRWDEELLSTFGLERARLPEARPSDGHFGDAVIEGLPTKLPILGVMGDSHASLFGQGGFDTGSTKATYGTGSSIMMNVGTKALPSPKGVVSSVGWGVGGSVNYVYEANVHSTGDTLRWVRDNLGLFSDYKEAEQLAASLADNGGVYLVPAFAGLGAPYWVHGVRAIITGLSRGSGRAQVIRAAFESIAFQVYEAVESMLPTEVTRPRELRVDGAPTANRFLMQFQADLFGSGIGVAPIEEVSARGVAFVAGFRSGLWRGLPELLRLSEPRVRYSAALEEGTRGRLLEGWHRAVQQAIGEGGIDMAPSA